MSGCKHMRASNPTHQIKSMKTHTQSNAISRIRLQAKSTVPEERSVLLGCVSTEDHDMRQRGNQFGNWYNSKINATVYNQTIVMILLALILACQIAYAGEQESAGLLNQFRSENIIPKQLEESAKKKQPQIVLEQQKDNTGKLSTEDYMERGVKLKPFVLKQVTIEDHHTFSDSEFGQFYQEYIGKKIDFVILNTISYRISKFYISKGFLLSHAYIPLDQDFSKGSLKIQIINGGIRKVHVLGTGSETDLIKEYQQKIIGSYPVTKKTIVRYIKLIGLMPGFDVQLVRIVPLPDEHRTSNREYADLIIVAKKVNNKVSLGVTNDIDKDYGDYSGKVMISMFSPFKKGEEIKLFYTSSNKHRASQNIAMIYKQPINTEGTTINTILSYAKSNPSVVDNLTKKINQSNSNYSLELEVSHPLILQNKFSLTGSAGIASDKDTQYGSIGKIKESKETELKASATIRYDDAIKGINYLILGVVKGMPFSKFKTIDTTDTIKKTYNKFTTYLYRWQPLIANFYASALVTGQYSGDALPSSKKMSFGGAGLVRGYRSDLVTASKGVGGALTLHHFSFFSHAYVKRLELYGFYSQGRIFPTRQERNQKEVNKWAKAKNLASLGYGAKATLAGSLKAGVEVAYPLKKLESSGPNATEIDKGKPYTTFFLEHVVEW